MGRTKVLVVDDDEAVTRLLCHKLKTAGIASDSADSAQQAIAMMAANLYRVVIADVSMPGMSGVEMVSVLKRHSSLVQVIMLTGTASLERVIDCVDKGAVDFFSKTEDLDFLVETVQLALTRAQRWMSFLGTVPAGPQCGCLGGCNE